MEQKMLRTPPLIATEYTPSEIVGVDNMRMLTKHLRLSLNHNGEFPISQLNKEVGPEGRDTAAQIFQALRDHGFYPLSVDDRGIKWGMAVKSRQQVEMERDLSKFQNMPISELQKMARNGYIEMRNDMGGFSERSKKPEYWETEAEKILSSDKF